MRALVSVLLLAACGSDPAPTVDAGETDTGVDAPFDAGTRPPRVGQQHLFDDVTTSAGIVAARPEDFSGLPERMGGGVCVLDVDGSPPMDLFFALRGQTHLYVADAPLAFVERTAEMGLDAIGSAMGCLAFDAEGDGDDDLLVTDVGSVRLFLREGAAFVEEDLGLRFDPRDVYTSSAAGDLDDDGDLDLVVAGMIRHDTTRIDPTCGEPCGGKVDIFDPIPGLVLRREDDGSYTEVAEELAPALALAENTLVVSITDLDGDGRVDIYVGNDLGGAFHNRALVRDEFGTYRDRQLETGLGHNARGYGVDTMGFSTADIDGNGILDHVATSFALDATAVWLCGDDRFCEPQRADSSGTDAYASSFRWGAALVDLDLDARPDLVEATGHIDSDEALVAFPPNTRDQRPNAMWNTGGRFVPVDIAPTDARATPRSARGIAVTDLDEDGRPDIVLAPAVGAPVLMRNAIEPFGRWLRVRLVGRPPNSGGLGARVRVRRGERLVAVQDRRAGEGYLGSFDPRLFFGLPGPGPWSVEATWPSGETTRLEDIEGDVEIELRQP